VSAVLFACCVNLASAFCEAPSAIGESMASAALAGAERSKRLIAATFGESGYREKDEALALEARQGGLDSVSAAWWGFNPKDSTSALRAALSSGAKTVLIPAMAAPWRTEPLELRGGLRLILEPGAELAALEGAFRGSGDCLMEAQGAVDLEIIGYGAAISMRKDDYRRPPYKEAQWRHAISLRETRGVRIAGLSIKDAGGDGVYIGQRRGRAVPEDILLEDLRILRSYRQGISVVSARGLRVLRCEITGTSGHLPGAGIDFEPNHGLFGFEDCLVSSCRIYGNDGPGIQVYLATRSAEDAPAGISVRDSEVSGFPNGVFVGGLGSGARGVLRLEGCRIGGLTWKSPGSSFALERD
jgi:hypothetical protein